MSSSNFRYYQAAANAINQGWLRGDFSDDDGNKCLVQSVLDAAGRQDRNLPNDMIMEIDQQLSHFRMYRLARKVFFSLPTDPKFAKKFGANPIQHAFIFWNDLPWRRKNTVFKVMNDLASNLESEWLRDERFRLSIEVENLKQEVERLRTRITKLEAENLSLWRRLFNSRALKSDKETLADLDVELSARFAELMEIDSRPEVVAV